MLRKIHQLDIIVNGVPVELYDPEKLNLRMNNVLFRPEEITSRTGEYSFSFEIPATPKNNKIFNFGNNMAKLNKFNTLYACDVNVDGINIFTGTLRLSDTATDRYTCNLISIKVNKVEDIFGDTMMNELIWLIDFDGTSTINQYNVDNSNERGVYFPLVCYGAFQKKPLTKYGDSYSIYSDLLQIDNTNRWFWQSFYPSFNLIELVRRLFAQKGYTVSGDILNDSIMKQIYLSTYIDGEQKPDYNYNKESIGTMTMAGSFDNKGKYAYISGMIQLYGGSSDPHAIGSEFNYMTEMTLSGIDNWTYQPSATSVPSAPGTLTYGYDPVSPETGHAFGDNFEKVAVYDVFGITDEQCLRWTQKPTNDFIYRHDKDTTTGLITIPADGFYSIDFEVTNVSIADETPEFRADRKRLDNGYVVTEPYDYTKSWDTMPLEIQLIRNTDEVELIGTQSNYYQYPHEPDYSKYSTVTGAGILSAFNERGYPADCDMYYVNKGETIAYDPYANEGFICGFTTMNESPAVIKNGRSWDLEKKITNNSRYISPGYLKHSYTTSADGTRHSVIERSEYNSNGLLNTSANYFSSSSQYTKNGRLQCVVELKKNDEIRMKAISRIYDNYLRKYTVSGWHTIGFDSGTNRFKFDFRLTITPYTPHTERYVNDFNMPFLPTEETRETGWGTKLNLGNFLNAKEKMADFVNNFIKTFNLQYSQVGNNVTFSTSKLDMSSLRAEIDIDDRVNTSEAKAERIDYPESMEVKWSIDDTEAGAYRSIDTLEHKSVNNWKDYIDRGSEKIQMDTTNESKTETVDSKFSYTWYQDFTYIDYDRDTRIPNGHVATFTLPLIAKDEDFIIQDDDSMKKDGYSLKQRLWFRQQHTQETLEMWNGEEAVVQIPTDEFGGCTLNYRKGIGTLLDRYFNVTPRTDSNYLIVECYLTPQEYIMLKNGAFTKFDDDLYLVSEVVGYDVTGVNKTELHLIKKV